MAARTTELHGLLVRCVVVSRSIMTGHRGSFSRRSRTRSFGSALPYLDAFHVTPTVIKYAATALALGVSLLLFWGLRTMIRLGRKPGERIFSDLPTLVHGPQELPDQSDRVRESHRRSYDG